jgi:hypothetical protein
MHIPAISSGIGKMAAQKRSNHNYIDLVDDENERRVAELQPSVARPIKDYLRGLVAAMRSTRGEAR